MSRTMTCPQPNETPVAAGGCSLRQTAGGASWVAAAGELSADTCAVVERTLRCAELRARLVVLDLREVTFIDLAAVRVIVYASVRARRVRRRLILVRGPAEVDRMFMLSGAAEIVEIGDLDPAPPMTAPVREGVTV